MVSTHACFYVVSLLNILQSVFGANVLISALYGEGSHFMQGASIGEGLVKRGHKATCLIGRAYDHRTTDPKYANLSFEVFEHQLTSAQEVRDFWKHEFNTLALEEGGLPQMIETVRILTDMMAEDCKGILLNNATMKRLEEIDAIVADITWPCGLMIKQMIEKRFNKKVQAVSLTPFTPSGVILSLYGSPYNPAYQPEYTTGFTNRMTFYQRIINVITSIVYPLAMGFAIIPHYSRVVTEVGLSQEMFTNISAGYDLYDLHLLSMDFSSEFPFPLAPNFIPVGGLTAYTARQLDQELAAFVEGSGDDGIIVFTLGTYFASITKLHPEFTAVFIEAFRRLPQRVIWQLTDFSQEKLPPNVKAMPWVPQNDLLGHPKTRVFLWQGGNNGYQEACYHGIPMVVIPLHGDQYDVGARIMSKGLGRMIDKFKIKADSIFEVLSDVINDPKYTEAAKRVSAIRKSMPSHPQDRAAFWIEHIIEFGGEYLKPPVYELSFIQYFMFDVKAFFLVILFAISALLYYITRQCMSLVCNQGRAKSKEE